MLELIFLWFTLTLNPAGTGPGSFGHYSEDMATFAEIGADFLKIDYCAYDQPDPARFHPPVMTQLGAWEELRAHFKAIGPTPRYTAETVSSARAWAQSVQRARAMDQAAGGPFAATKSKGRPGWVGAASPSRARALLPLGSRFSHASSAPRQPVASLSSACSST